MSNSNLSIPLSIPLCALLIGISKLLSRENVQQLVFVTMELIENRQLSEKCEESGNALPLFQAMRDRDLYTHTDPSLLLEHLKIIGRLDAVMMLEKEMDDPSQKNHSADQVQGAMQWSPAPVACHARLNGDFKDGACNLDTDMAPFHQGCTGGTKEPEASLQGDATSPSNFPVIPDRHHPDSKGLSKLQGLERELTAVTSAGNYPAVPERPPREGNKGRIGPSASVSSSPGSVTTQTAALASTGNDPVVPKQFPREGNRDTKGSSEHGLGSPGPDRTHATVTSSDIPARPPRGCYENLPIQESRKIFTDAIQRQTVNAARPDATHTIHAVEIHRPQGQGIERMYQPRIEVEQLQARPPPVPKRPPRRPNIANCGVTELELCQLSRHFDAGVIDLFGLELGYSSQRISQLMYDSPRDISNVFYRLMVDWRSAQHGGFNMRENLANHLRNIKCTELAHDLEVGRFR